jgi:cytochrome c-type biogenesis protein CcmH
MKKLALIFSLAAPALLLALGFALLLAAPGAAQSGQPGPVTDDQVNAVAKFLYCPVCENIPLDVCPTQACADWRQEIRDLLYEGYTAAEVRAMFAERYGDRVLAAPPPRGFNLLAYVVPAAAIILGAFILYRAFAAWRQPLPETSSAESPPASGAEHQDEYIARMESELRKR